MAVQPSRAELARLLVEDNAALGRGASALARRRHGLGLLLGWLERAEAPTWQARWERLGEPPPTGRRPPAPPAPGSG
jgi:hypothetical protein